MSAIEVDIGVYGAKSEIKVERRRGHEGIAGDFIESVIEITVVNVDVIVGHHSARTDIGMPVCNDDIRACIGLLVVKDVEIQGESCQRQIESQVRKRCS